MNFSFLPESVRTALSQVADGELPLSVVRASEEISGAPGESYLVTYADRLFIFSRKLGADAYQKLEAELRDGVGNIALRKESFYTFLDIDLGDKTFSLKFSTMDVNELGKTLARWHDLHESGTPELPSGVTDDAVEESCSPLSALAAALMFAADADDRIAPEEDQYIVDRLGGNREVLNRGLTFFKSHSFEELLDSMADFSCEQQICILANVLEIAMSDGELKSVEQELIRRFVERLEIPEEEYQTIRQVLILKNRLGVLSRSSQRSAE